MTSSQKFINNFVTINDKKIRKMVEWKAFKFYVDPDDLHGELNLAISRIYENSAFEGTETHFWRYIHLSIHTSAIDLKRRRSTKWNPDPNLDITDIQESYCLSTSNQPDINQKLLIKRICNEFSLTFKKDSWRIVWQEHFINGLPYDQVAEIAGIPIGTVKGTIFKIRKYANKTYYNQYKEAV